MTKKEKQPRRYKGLSEAEKKWVKSQERRGIIMTIVSMVAFLLIIAWLIVMLGEAFGR
jgi:preprotein translocase subunit SecE